MINRNELLKSEEYWFEVIQNEIYRMVADHLDKNGINQNQFAEKLGVTKGYVSQVMKGNFNYTLKKLIELSIASGKVPVLEFKDVEAFLLKDRQHRVQLDYSNLFSVKPLSGRRNLADGEETNVTYKEQNSVPFTFLKIA